MAARPMRVGIIGLGHIGRTHVAAIDATPGMELAALCDCDANLSKLAPSGIPFYQKSSDFLYKNELDVVIVATPNDTHCEIALEAIQSSHSVIVEKPAARSMEELDHLLSAARKAEVNLYFAFHAARAKEVGWFRKWYEQEGVWLGPVTAFESSFSDPYVSTKGKLVPHSASLGNCWTDSGINALSVLGEFFDPFGMELHCFQTSSREKDRPITRAVAKYRFSIGDCDSEGHGVIETDWTRGVNHKQTRFIFGRSDYSVLLNHSLQTATMFLPNGNEKILVDFSSEGERLFNHYCELFLDYLICQKSGDFLWDKARRYHELLYKVYIQENKMNELRYSDNAKLLIKNS